jgi:formate/nitrite transporter FocA (FNT family)
MNGRTLKIDVATFARAVFAGIMIGIGGCIYLSIDVKIVGALLFTAGLYTICIQGLNLYTGKVGYLPDKTPGYIADLVVIWFGNLCGTYIAALAVRETRVAGISETAKAICEVKLKDSPESLFFLGVFCGILMFIAVDGYAKTKNPIILFLGVSAFILCGFEHCIADMFYFFVAGMWSNAALKTILIITLGNSVGGMLLSLIKKLG